MNFEKLELIKHYIKERKLAKINHDLGIKPYCNDEIINNNWFVNISRRDDFVSKQILEKYKDVKDTKDLLLNIGIARWFSRRTTIEALKIYKFDTFNIDSFINDIETIRLKNGVVGTSRFLLTTLDYKKFIKSLVDYISNFDLSYLDSKESFAKSLKGFKLVQGNFYTWQFLSDLVMFGLIPDDNNFIILGPGAKKGLAILDSTVEVLSKELELSYEDLEHTLCEFMKYNRIFEK